MIKFEANKLYYVTRYTPDEWKGYPRMDGDQVNKLLWNAHYDELWEMYFTPEAEYGYTVYEV